jgi:hypothetical protein
MEHTQDASRSVIRLSELSRHSERDWHITITDTVYGENAVTDESHSAIKLSGHSEGDLHIKISEVEFTIGTQSHLPLLTECERD